MIPYIRFASRRVVVSTPVVVQPARIALLSTRIIHSRISEHHVLATEGKSCIQPRISHERYLPLARLISSPGQSLSACTYLCIHADEFDKLLTEQVQAGTSDELISPDVNINLTIVDMVNHNPAIMSEKLWKILRRTVQAKSSNAKVLLLSLTILETCIKSCSSPVYQTLADSELWDLLVKMAADTSATRVDGEVRDKILTLVEDYAGILPQKEYTDAFERLLEAGVDFPARPPGDQTTPVLNPPLPHPFVDTPNTTPEQHHELLSSAALDGQRAVNQAARPPARFGPPSAAAHADPFAGMSDEDKAAVKKAMEELEEEAQTFRQAEAVAAATAITEQMRAQDEQMRAQDEQMRAQDERQRVIEQRQQQLMRMQQQR